MKILLVNDYGTPAGGAEVIVFGLRAVLRARGHDVRVFASAARDGDAPLLADDVCHGTTGEWRTHLQCMNLPAARELRRVLARFQPDVVHVNLYLTQLSPFILRELRGIPSVYYAQWYRAICPLGTRRLPTGETCRLRAGIACLRSGCVPRHYWPPLMAQMTLDRRWGRRFSRVTAISRAVADRLGEYGAPHLRTATVVHPGTAAAEARTASEMTPTPSVVTAGRLVPEKGVDVLIRAFARIVTHHPTARLVVVGDGPSRESLVRLAADAGVAERVDFRGQLSHGDTLAEIRRSWISCVPSLWEEPFGMIAAEAQMHGVAVVASHTGGLSEIVEDGVTGYLVPPGDVDALAARLDAMFADRVATLAMGGQGHERARKVFSLDAFADRFEAIYRDVMAAHRGRS